MDLSRMLCDTTPLGLQVQSSQTIPQLSHSNPNPAQTASTAPVANQSLVQPISTAAARGGSSDVSMQYIASGTPSPKENHISADSSPGSRSPAPPSPVAQTPGPQISTPPLQKGDGKPSRRYSQSKTLQREATLPISAEFVTSFVGNLQQIALKYHSLTDDVKEMVAEHILSLPVPMTELANLLNAGRLSTAKIIRKRKFYDPDFQPAEDGFDPPSPSPSSSRSKKSNFRDVKDSRFHESRDGNSEDVGTELAIETFRTVCGREPQGPSGIAEKAAHRFCQKILHLDIFVQEGTPKFASKIPRFAGRMKQPPELNLVSAALQIPINNDEDRKIATKKLIRAYYEENYDPPLFFQIWNVISLADLVEPLWKNGRNKNETFVRWAYRAWKKDCNPNLNEKLFPKMSLAVAEAWGRKMVAGRYWRQWCNVLSGGKSDSKHRGALLLLLAAVDDRRGIQPERDTDHEDEINFAKEYISTALPWVPKAATILNPVAEQLYQKGEVQKQDLENLERSLCAIPVD